MGSPFADATQTYYTKTKGETAKVDIETAQKVHNYVFDKGPKLVLCVVGLSQCGFGSPVTKTFVATALALVWEELRMRFIDSLEFVTLLERLLEIVLKKLVSGMDQKIYEMPFIFYIQLD